MTIAVAREKDLGELLPLMRAYCDFYAVAPPDEALLALSRALLADPACEGVQLLAREAEGGPAGGFAPLFWTWSTLAAGRIGVMNDLFVVPAARGGGAAAALIEACVERCRERGAVWLGWQTAKDNHRAQRLYDRLGARRAEWIDYGLPVR